MDPTLIAAAASALAPSLFKLFDTIRGTTAAGKPDAGAFINALKTLLTQDPLGDFSKLGDKIPVEKVQAAVQFLQKTFEILGPGGVADGVIDSQFIERLRNQCSGRVRAQGSVPPNRATLPLPDPSTKFDEPTRENSHWFLVRIDQLPSVPDATAKDVARDCLIKAFNAWQRKINLRIEFVTGGFANLAVTVCPIDGPGGTLALGTVGSGVGNTVGQQYELKIDAAETWTPEKFQYALCHEIGHILGLEHSHNETDLMYDTVRLDTNNKPAFDTPQDNDIARAKAIWGPAPQLGTAQVEFEKPIFS